MFDLTEDQLAIREAIRKLMAPFDEAYWRACDEEHRFPDEFRAAMAEGGWLGVAMPEAYGGAGLGVLEAVVMMEAVANSPGAMAAASSIHMNIFGPEALNRHGTAAQKARWLPKIAAGELVVCFGVTEPDAGLDTTHIKTTARRTDTGYVIDGRKIWTSTAQQAARVILLTRTTPIEEVEKPTDGMTLFFAPLDPAHVEIREIAKMGRHAVNSNMVFYDQLPVSEEDRIGEEGKGFRILLDSLNPERCLVAAEAIGVGRHALSLATDYAREREVFGRPIGRNQSIQHPLAESHMKLEAAWLTTLRAAALFDAGAPCGIEANSAKYLAAEAGYEACERAVLTHGGMGYAAEYAVERFLREIWINRLAPVSQQLILCHVAERALGLPKSY
ncbi:acyl-CoA dehydrogenase family protein [Pikeienuella sp. HZG-20]|uniref:acyl-CoA dehydrogenase family protein n=1 Tax=Paludibacillus litoralis TaxID=3133267 RepID=UPI0030ED0D4C